MKMNTDASKNGDHPFKILPTQIIEPARINFLLNKNPLMASRIPA